MQTVQKVKSTFEVEITCFEGLLNSPPLSGKVLNVSEKRPSTEHKCSSRLL
uniref:Uncharacterized protein n=1 Tax=Anguilla anguilla TaxID=7936 RepID=A0A0E9QE97_ANGAN